MSRIIETEDTPATQTLLDTNPQDRRTTGGTPITAGREKFLYRPRLHRWSMGRLEHTNGSTTILKVMRRHLGLPLQRSMKRHEACHSIRLGIFMSR